MSDEPRLTFFHSPNTRSTGVAILLDELGAPHDTHLIDMTVGDQRKPEFLAINPMGKVPAILHGDALVTEQVAIFIYLADLFPSSGLAPAVTSMLRGPYLRWLAYYGSSFEPAAVDRALKREPGPRNMSPYGDFDTVISTLTGQLGRNQYITGDSFTAADILWGGALGWMLAFKIVPELPELTAYADRVRARPAFTRAAARDAETAAVFAAAHNNKDNGS